ncbi:hypothetical protein [Streptomyces sp. CA-106110]|uniref:hypothetical protein n=1 Tax=Streptomyces sp. CA-106110 TaxID=3240044 RepID=UPI003D8C6E42
MSESTSAVTGLTSQYAAQVTGDLEHNVKEQDRLSAEIAGLQEQLAALQSDHLVLVNVQQALGISSAPIPPAATPDSTTVPAPRTKAAADTGAGKRTRAKKADTAAPSRTTAKKPAGKAAAVKTAQLTLVELVRRHLTGHSEPRSAADVTTALATAHPERGIKATVVRTTLEGLVAKNQARRAKQGASVYYTAANAAEQTATLDPEQTQSKQAE